MEALQRIGTSNAKVRVTWSVKRWSPVGRARALDPDARGDGKSIASAAGRGSNLEFHQGIWMTRIVTMMTRTVLMVTALAFFVPALCSGQDPLAPTRLEVDRAALTRLLDQYDAIVQSTAYSDVLRDEGRAQADIIRDRLRIGDFRPGDQIALFIGGGSAVQWDTLIVEAGPLIDVPALGPILLHGVLRSELETHLATEIGRFIQLPKVQAHALIRVSVVGGGRSGFYVMPANLLLSEAVMMAGGPGRRGSESDPDRTGTGRDLVGRRPPDSVGRRPHAGRPGATGWGQNLPTTCDRVCC